MNKEKKSGFIWRVFDGLRSSQSQQSTDSTESGESQDKQGQGGQGPGGGSISKASSITSNQEQFLSTSATKASIASTSKQSADGTDDEKLDLMNNPSKLDEIIDSLPEGLDDVLVPETVTPSGPESQSQRQQSLNATYGVGSKISFPHHPTALAFDPIQRIIAIGTRSGSLRILGRPEGDVCVQHSTQFSQSEAGSSSSSRHHYPSSHHHHLSHPFAVFQLIFVINEGSLISICADESIHCWNLREKQPSISQTLQFNKEERITTCRLPVQCKWLYIGTERGNVHILNIETFQLSGYVINWNKAIELTRKTHPGAVVALSDCPQDQSKLLIGFDSGTIVLWDLKAKAAELRFNYAESIKSMAWHHEGRQFICAHGDGSLTTWDLRKPNFSRPASISYPHAKNIDEDLQPEKCKPIWKTEWKTLKSNESYILFSGGASFSSNSEREQAKSGNDGGGSGPSLLTAPGSGSSSGSGPTSSSTSPRPPNTLGPYSGSGSPSPTPERSPCSSKPLAVLGLGPGGGPQGAAQAAAERERERQPVYNAAVCTENSALASQTVTILHGKTTTVLEMDGNVIDFVTLCENPWESEVSQPYAILVLLNNDLVVVDLSSPGVAHTVSFSTTDRSPSSGVTTNFLRSLDDPASNSLIKGKPVPEQPQRGGGFSLTGFLLGGPTQIDWEEIFGEQAAGKPSRAVAKFIPGTTDRLQRQTGNLGDEMAKLREGFMERGERLEQVEDRTQRMATEADKFSSTSHQLMLKYRDKKWYQF